MHRRVRARREIQVRDGTGNSESDSDSLHLGIEVDVQHRLQLHWIGEGDRALVDGVLGSEKVDLALRDVQPSQQHGVVGRTLQPEAPFHLKILRQRTLEADVRRRLDPDIELHPAQRSGARRGRTDGLGSLSQNGREIRPRIEAGAHHRDRARQHAALGGSAQAQFRVGGGAGALRISYAHILCGCVHTVGELAAGVSDRSAQRDGAATHLAGEILNRSLTAAEHDGSVHRRKPTGDVGEVQRSAPDVELPVHQWLVRRPANRGVDGHCSGGLDVRLEVSQHGQVDLAVHA